MKLVNYWDYTEMQGQQNIKTAKIIRAYLCRTYKRLELPWTQRAKSSNRKELSLLYHVSSFRISYCCSYPENSPTALECNFKETFIFLFFCASVFVLHKRVFQWPNGP